MSRLSIFSSKTELYLANTVLIGLACFFGLWLIKFIIAPSPLINFFGYFILTISVILPLVALKFSALWRIKLSMTLLGFVLALYCFEFCLMKIESYAERALQKDKQKYTFIFESLAANNQKHSIPIGTLSLLSAINGNVLGDLKTSKCEMVPLGNLAFTPTFLCHNPQGPIIFQSDRYGFNNEDQVWNSKISSVAVLGDSYVEGVCVKPEKNILTEIIKEYPNSLNLGIVGQGPLTMLGVIKEYLVHKQPKAVVWCYTSNDIYPNLTMEKDNKILKKYLSDDFSQNLINRQSEVDETIENYFQVSRKKTEPVTKNGETEDTKKPPQLQILNSKFFKLYRVRQKIFRSVLTKLNSDYKLFEEVIDTAKKTVDTWEGKIIFVYLPGPERFYKNQIDPAKEKILEIISRNGIEIIDMEVEMLKDSNPKDFYVNSQSHYNERGYQFVSKEILKRVKAQR